MRRRIPNKQKREPTIALINIVFLMLVFFMVAGTLTTSPIEDLTHPLTPAPAPQPVRAVQEARPVLIEPTQHFMAKRPETATPPLTAPELNTSPVSHLEAKVSLRPLANDLASFVAEQLLAVLATPPAETLQALPALEQSSAAPSQSKRPERRDPKKATRHAAVRSQPDAIETKKVSKKAKQKRGNATRNNTQGASAGTNPQSTLTDQGTGRAAKRENGNAAASNYPGQVIRRISRVPKPRIRAGGTAVVSFSISSSGGLGSVTVTHSSGSVALDRAALGVIRKAAPFPVPPRAAKRQFSIRIKSK